MALNLNPDGTFIAKYSMSPETDAALTWFAPGSR
jgi:hypothetical protein